MLKIIYFDVEDYEIEYLKQKNEGKYDYILVEKSLNVFFDIPTEYRDAQIISCFTTSRIGRDVLINFPQLALIALRSVGFNHVDMDYCNERGIIVVNTPNYGNKSVAEFAFGLMIDVCRKITRASLDFKDINVVAPVLMGWEFFGKTVGIIGLGAIGLEFVKLAKGFGMNILAYDFNKNQEVIELFGVKYVDFETLVRESDFISLHAPSTKENYHMFNYEVFSKMKSNAILINTARGELIDTQALYNALKQKLIAGAGLDVLESEETIADLDYLNDINRLNDSVLKQTILNTRLQHLDNVIITPHIAYNTHEAVQRILEITMHNIDFFEKGLIDNNLN